MRAGMILVCLAAICATGARAAEPGLVAHWTFDEGRGNTAQDATGNGHDAALKHTEWVRSPRGYALRFAGKEALAQYGKVASMNLSGDATLAVWVKTDSAVEPRTNRLIFGDTGLGIERNLNLRMDGYGYLRFEWADGKANASLLAPAGLLNGSWKHVVVVANSRARQASLYVDGVSVAEMTMPLPISVAPTKERLTGWFYNGYFQGDLDDVRLYSRALSAQEVRQLYRSQADVTVGAATLLYDGDGAQPRGISAVTVRNQSREPRRVELAGPGLAPREVTLQPGAEAEVALGSTALQPIWRGRNDLFACEEAAHAGRLTVTTRLGESADVQRVSPAQHLVLEPLQVSVRDPWQRKMAPGRTESVAIDLRFALPAERLRQGALAVRLVSRESGKDALVRQVRAPAPVMPLMLDVRSLPWGAYDMTLTLRGNSGRPLVSTKRVVTLLPAGAQRIRVLNNLVSELMDARSRSLLRSRRIEFMNPRDGWVWFRAAGDCGLRLGEQPLLSALPGKPPVEAMRLLPAGRQVVHVSGTLADLTIRAIPGLLYNVYPSAPQIQPFGGHTWERLRKHTLPNTNMIESQVIDTPEYAEWIGQGKLWIANVQAPGLIDKEDWTPEKMLQVWSKPRGWDLAKIGGIQSDEYYPGVPTQMVLTTALSVARLAEDPAFAGKLWIPFAVGMYGTQASELFMKTSLGAGWPFSVEVYEGEMPTEAENLANLRSRFLGVSQGWERAYPGSMRRAIFTPMYAYLPYCTTNRYPQADFRVHLDMQMHLLASDPAFFGLWGVQPYRSNYVDEEILHCMGRMLRHYCIEGKTDRMLDDPYELRHAADPDFEEGTKHWQIAPAEEGAITAGKFAGYGQLQGRYPGGAFGDTFVLLKRSAKAPNAVSQELRGLQAGRVYSLKAITADYADLQAGKTRKDEQVLTIKVEGAETLEGGFRCPFRSARGPKPFSMESPFWMTYHWMRFRAQGPTARLTLSDWAGPTTPGGPTGQQMMLSFIEVQPVEGAE